MTSIQPASDARNNNPLSKRRRFQPPITSFFSSAGSSSADSNDDGTVRLSHHNYSSPTFSAHPALPHKVQASLLTVGMRIRKSVPEGYKTEARKSSVYSLASASSTSPTTTTTTTTSSSSSSSSSSSLSCCSASRASYSELAPYCGVHKVGNLAVQTFPDPAGHQSSTTTPEVSTDEGDVFSLPSSSQSSISTASIPPPNSHKRTFSDEDSSDDDDGLVPFNNDTINNRVTINSGRTILSPKLGRQQQHRRYVSSPLRNNNSNTNNNKTWAQQQNRERFAMDLDDDFEEAAFLRRREEVDSDYVAPEVEMEVGGA